MEKLCCKLQYSKIVGDHCLGVLSYKPIEEDVKMGEE